MSTTPEPASPMSDPDGVDVVVGGPNPWLLMVVLGGLLCILGLWLIFSSRASQGTVAILLAIGLFLGGLSEFLWSPDRRRPWVGFVLGALFLLAGVLVLVETEAALRTFATVIGIILIVIGMFEAAAAVVDRDAMAHWGWLLAFGLITVAFGVAAIVWPSATIRVLGFLFGLRLLFLGIGTIGLGASLKGATRVEVL